MPANRKQDASLPAPHDMTKDEARTDGETDDGTGNGRTAGNSPLLG